MLQLGSFIPGAAKSLPGLLGRAPAVVRCSVYCDLLPALPFPHARFAIAGAACATRVRMSNVDP